MTVTRTRCLTFSDLVRLLRRDIVDLEDPPLDVDVLSIKRPELRNEAADRALRHLGRAISYEADGLDVLADEEYAEVLKAVQEARIVAEMSDGSQRQVYPRKNQESST